MKKILILSGSPRIGGNSDLLCDEFMRGAIDAGHDVTKINVARENVGYCIGCYFCAENDGKCIIKDGMADILQKIIDCDAIVLAGPVFFHSIGAQLKTVLDRTIARRSEIKNKDFYYIATYADDTATEESTLAGFRGYADCIEGSKEMGAICSLGAYQKGQIAGSPSMSEAYAMGKNIK